MAQPGGVCNAGLLFNYPFMYGYINSKTCSGTPSSTSDYSSCSGGARMFKGGVAISGTPSGGGDERRPTSAPTAGVVHLVGDVTLSNIDYSLFSTKDINDLVNGAETSLRALLNIDSSYITVSVSRGSRRRLLRRLDSVMDLALDLSATLLAQMRADHLNPEEKSETAETAITTTDTARITPATTPSDTVVIHFTIDAVSTYLASHLSISSTSTVAVISDNIENKIDSGSGSSFKYYLQNYVNSYGTTSLKNSVANSNYQSASVAEKSSDSSSSSDSGTDITMIIGIVVGVVGGIGFLSSVGAGIYFCFTRNQAGKQAVMPFQEDNKMGSAPPGGIQMSYGPGQFQPQQIPMQPQFQVQPQQGFQPMPQPGAGFQPAIANPYQPTVVAGNGFQPAIANPYQPAGGYGMVPLNQ
jgi:hypothetical protein